ncbi:hypothetical protein HK102_004384 [Quaeritorhiza haematococci]|nr:hypothetical protein HK102_004384 [Quaeritorhiza haematococci]
MTTGSTSSLSLQNSVLAPAQLISTPSQADGIDAALEADLRNFACELIETAGILLKLPQVAMATAQVLLQRFYYTTSFKAMGIRDVVMGSIFLASKIEECPRKIRDIINVFDYLISYYRGIPYKPLEYSGQKFYEYKDGMIAAEINILAKLGFNVHVQHAYGFMINYLKILNLADNREFAQKAWNYLNDR